MKRTPETAASTVDSRLLAYDHQGSPRYVFYGGGRRIRTSEVVRRQIYSLFPLAARESLHGISQIMKWSWRWDSNPQPADYKSAALPIELRQRELALYYKSKISVKFFYYFISIFFSQPFQPRRRAISFCLPIIRSASRTLFFSAGRWANSKDFCSRFSFAPLGT